MDKFTEHDSQSGCAQCCIDMMTWRCQASYAVINMLFRHLLLQCSLTMQSTVSVCLPLLLHSMLSCSRAAMLESFYTDTR